MTKLFFAKFLSEIVTYRVDISPSTTPIFNALVTRPLSEKPNCDAFSSAQLASFFLTFILLGDL